MSTPDASSALDAAGPPAGRGRGGYRSAVLLLAVCGAGMLWAAASTWVTATASPAGLPQVTVSATGNEVLPSVGAAGIVALAGIAGVWATRGRWRTLIGALLVVVIGWATVAVAVFAVSLPSGASDAVANAAGVLPDDLLQTSVAPWWLLALAAAIVGVVGAVMVTLRGAAWSSMGDRYSRGSQASTALTSAQVWDALDRGEDPTIDPEVSQ